MSSQVGSQYCTVNTAILQRKGQNSLLAVGPRLSEARPEGSTMREVKRGGMNPQALIDGAWLKYNRERYNQAQSDVAAYLRVQLRKTVNQARVHEWEKGKRVMRPEVVKMLEAYFKSLEAARQQNRDWVDLPL